MATLHHLFETARREWGVPLRENPLADLNFKANEDRRERRLRQGEWERLIHAAQEARNPFIAPIMVLALETGMRRGEILGIRWEHLSWTDQSLLIPDTKNGWTRTIPLTKKAIETISLLRSQ